MEREGEDPLGAPEAIEIGGVRIAYRHRVAAEGRPTIQWLGGWRSDMRGGKALELDALARERGWAMLRHDYSGHGESGGSIEDGTISLWVEQSLMILDRAVDRGPIMLAGSSMGAWIALRMAERMRERGDAERLVGLLLIAPAPDFVTELMEPLSDANLEALERDGRFLEHSEYSDEPNVWTAEFMDDGRRNRTMAGPLNLPCPAHIVQGTADNEVPLAHAEKLFGLMAGADAAMTVVRDGDHRMSRPQDLSLIRSIASQLLEREDRS